MSTLSHRDYLGPFAGLADWLELPPWAVLRPVTGHPLRVEDYVKDGQYVVRAELPGLDPDKDVEVTVSNGVLTISAHRQQQAGEKRRSEFRYGSFARSISLPEGADEDHIQASYDRGILEVVVSIQGRESDKTPRRIPVMPS